MPLDATASSMLFHIVYGLVECHEGDVEKQQVRRSSSQKGSGEAKLRPPYAVIRSSFPLSSAQWRRGPNKAGALTAKTLAFCKGLN